MVLRYLGYSMSFGFICGLCFVVVSGRFRDVFCRDMLLLVLILLVFYFMFCGVFMLCFKSCVLNLFYYLILVCVLVMFLYFVIFVIVLYCCVGFV